jgi:hypothetical protein
MTKKDKFAWALVTPFLTALAGGIVLTIYIAITEAPMAALAIAVILAAITGSYMLQHDPEDTEDRSY